MLEHTSSSQQSQTKSAYSHLDSSPEVQEALPSAVLERIEDYMDQVCAPLVKYLPYAERKERRNEMQIHLESLTQAHIELGSDPLEAVTQALQQFGSPKKITRQWLREWEWTYLDMPTRSARPATKLALRYFAASSLLMAFVIAGFDTILARLHHYMPPGLRIAAITAQILLISLQLSVGFLVGLRVHSRPVLGALYAQAMTLPLMPYVESLSVSWFKFGAHSGDGLPWVSLAFFAFGAPLGCLGAFCGSLVRRHNKRKSAISS